MEVGRHNADPAASRERIFKGATYRDQSTVCVVPSRDGTVNSKVEDCIDGLVRPMNHPFIRLNMANYEVGDAYDRAIQEIQSNPGLQNFKFMLTVETDNLPPPDGLIKLLGHIYASPYAGVSGLYWTKGEGGMPMIYGNPHEFPINFRPQLPQEDMLQECRGIAMGFGLWELELFKDKRLGPPWFETKQAWNPVRGVEMGTQDLVFCAKAAKLGYRFAVATDIKVGHIDFATGVVW